MKKVILLLFAFVFLVGMVSAADVNVYEFYSIGCMSCAAVDESGVLDRVSELNGVNFTKLDAAENYDLFQYYVNGLNAEEIVPIVVIESDGKYAYLAEDGPIIKDLEKYVFNPEEYVNLEINEAGDSGQNIGLVAVILAGIVDSINPCAFGVLIFLMVALLNLGSRKRALKAGLLYSFIVFLVYFIVGLGLFEMIQKFSELRGVIYVSVGAFIMILGIIETRDYFAARGDRDAILRISPKIKPFIESKAKNGTLVAIMVMGVVVALFELPCTGGIYLGIISLLTNGGFTAYLYLLIYNLVFILPLVILTFLVYYGISPKVLENWNTNEKAWMRLGAAIVMFVIAGYLIYIGL